jgi:putative peptidoglycan lipid II flippase
MTDEAAPTAPPGAPADRSKMARAAAGISVLTAAGFLTGLVVKMVLSRLLGTGSVANAYNYVYRLTQDVFRNWEKLIRPSFLPVLTREREQSGEKSAWRFTGSVVLLQSSILAVITLVLALFARPIVGALTDFGGETAHRAQSLLVFIAPSVFFLSLSVTFYMVLNSCKRFQLAAFGDQFFVKLGPLVALAALWRFIGIHALIAGIVLGAVAKLALYVWGLRGELRSISFRPSLKSPAMRALGILILPLLAGVLVAFLRNRGEDLLLSSVLGGSAMTMVTYARAPVDIPIQLFPAALSIAIFPFISEYFLKKRHEELFAILGKGIRIIVLAFLPLSAGLLLLAQPLIDTMFGGGRFTPQDVLLTASALRWYAAGCVFFGFEVMLLQFFYAARDTWTPTYTGIITSLLQLHILAYLVIMKADDVGAFTLAFTVSKFLKVALLSALLVRVYPHARPWVTMLRRTLPAVFKICLATACMGVGVHFLAPAAEARLRPRLDAVLLRGVEAFLPHTWPLQSMVRLAVGAIHLAVVSAAGAVIFAVGVHVLRVEEWRQGLAWVKGKLGRR